MRKFYTIILASQLMAAMPVGAQIVTTDPSPLQESSQNVVIIYDATQGNKGLENLPESEDVYAHIGVVTNLSNGSWAYAPAWLDNAEKYKLTRESTNIYKLEIGDIRTYFGVKNPSETVEKLAMVFRTATGSREGKTATGSDIFVDVLPAGFQMEFSTDSPLVLNSNTSTVKFKVVTTEPANIALYLAPDATTPFASIDNATSLDASYTFSQGDSYKVTAMATASDGTVATDSKSICYPRNSISASYPGGNPEMGAVAQPDGSVIFCIGAPGKSNAMVIGSWSNYEASNDCVMDYTDIDGIRYFWAKVDGLDPDTEYPYYYLIDETTAVGDPYARLVLDPFSDKWLSDGTYPGLIPYPAEKIEGNVMLAVYKGSRDDYDWRVEDFKDPAPEDLIIYELLLRDFTGTEGQARGNGNLKLAMKKLDYLEQLGINAIELMPIQEFNGNNSWGYNTNFYFAPDKAYGTPDDYREFIDECHSRGIAVILDVVFNQSDGLHPWYQMYPAGSNPFYNERAPHAYSVLNDWCQDNMLVQQQWIDMIRYWMTAYKVDGFRFDLVKGLGNNDSYGNNASESNTNKYNASRVERMKILTDVMFSINPDAYSINENLAGEKEENEMAANGQLNWANINEQACQFAMGYSSDSNTSRFYAPRDSRTWGSTVSYAESHDEQRMAYKQNQWGVEGVKGDLDMSMRRLGSVAAQMILCPGAHMIWQFGELGNGTSTKNTNGSNNTDPKPVYWNYLKEPARLGLHNSYMELISIRNSNTDLFARDAQFSIQCAASNWTNGRFIYASTPDKEMICVINPTLEAATFNNVKFKDADSNSYRIATASYDTNPMFDASAGTVTLDAGAYVVITNGNVADVDLPVVDGTTATTPSVVYDLQGRRCNPDNLSAGVYVVISGGKATKIAIR